MTPTESLLGQATYLGLGGGIQEPTREQFECRLLHIVCEMYWRGLLEQKHRSLVPLLEEAAREDSDLRAICIAKHKELHTIFGQMRSERREKMLEVLRGRLIYYQEKCIPPTDGPAH